MIVNLIMSVIRTASILNVQKCVLLPLPLCPVRKFCGKNAQTHGIGAYHSHEPRACPSPSAHARLPLTGGLNLLRAGPVSRFNIS